MKNCSKCNLNKTYTEFYKDKQKSDGLTSSCKACIVNASSQYQKMNISKITLRRTLSKDKQNLYAKEYRAKNKEILYLKHKEYVSLNKEELRKNRKKYMQLRRKMNIPARIADNLRSRVYKVVKGKIKTGSSVADLGCSIPFLKDYLESKFQPGMTWENYGKWHIDHIRPLSSFDLTERGQFLLACNYTNLQPLWATENISKGAKFEVAV